MKKELIWFEVGLVLPLWLFLFTFPTSSWEVATATVAVAAGCFFGLIEGLEVIGSSEPIESAFAGTALLVAISSYQSKIGLLSLPLLIGAMWTLDCVVFSVCRRWFPWTHRYRRLTDAIQRIQMDLLKTLGK